ncbi:MAG: alkaline phosphatase, partial [Planctomycetaceae bacterium]|nr:alkaline phosphatase [Planctomycetaceae bacterium]
MILWAVALFFVITDVFAQDSPKAKNVIILIGDGMGFGSDLAGTYYRYGEAGKQSYHSFPVHVACTTYAQAKAGQPIPADCKGYDPEAFWASLTGGTQDTEFTCVTDSAASSTAIHSGVKTLNGRIGVDDQNNPVELVSEIAYKTGRKVGSVTTVPIGHATPAGFCAHVVLRGDMDEIFLQMSDTNSLLTVVMGAGHPFYVNGRERNEDANETEATRKSRFLAVGGKATWEKMEGGTRNGFTVIDTKKQFEALASGTALPEKVIGIARSWGNVPPIDAFLNDIPATQKLFESTYPKTEVDELPDLTTMSLGAINLLTQNNDRGFILMIEGGAIDWANHGRYIKQSVLEHTGFSKAIDAVIQWVETKSSWDETLVIVTADHETGQLWGPGTYRDENGNGVWDHSEDVFNGFQPIENLGRGNVPNVQYGTGGHTTGLVPLYAKGPGAELFLKHISPDISYADSRSSFPGVQTFFVENRGKIPGFHGF